MAALHEVYRAVLTLDLNNPAVWYGSIYGQRGWWCRPEGVQDRDVIYLGRNKEQALRYVERRKPKKE